MNGLVAYGRPATIVLDDLHAVVSEHYLGSIAHATKRLPANARLLACTRSDPAISVARLRARGALTEIRAGELAFTVDEAAQMFVRKGIELPGESVELLLERTEGWPAGLYLAALWLRDLEDPNDGVRAFAGSERHVADFLSDEVLTALSPQIRDFLVRTSVLGRFTPQLCDAVLGREDSAAVLAELERSNMFLVALDARGEWYRYHHLFRECWSLSSGSRTRRCCAGARRRGAGRTDWSRMRSGTPPPPGTPRTVAELLVESHRQFVWGGQTRTAAWLGAVASRRAAARAPVAARQRGDGRGAARAARGRGPAAARGGQRQGASALRSGRRTPRRSSKSPARR